MDDAGDDTGAGTMIEHTIIAVKNTAYITIKQSPDVDAFIHATRIFMHDPEYSPGLNRICDFSQSNLSHITAHDFSKFADFAMTEMDLAPEAKVALVAPAPSKRGIFEQLTNKIDTGIFRIFSEPEDAMIWVNQAPKEDDLPGPLTSMSPRKAG